MNSKQLSGRSVLDKSIEPNRAAPAPPAGADYLYARIPWVREDAFRKHRICLGIERRVNQGQPLCKAIRRASWYYKRQQRFYRTAPAIRVRFSEGTIKALWYRWVSGGKTPDAVALRYKAPTKLPVSELLEVAAMAMEPGVLSFMQAWRRMKHRSATSTAYHHAMDPKLRKAVAAMLRARRHAIFLEREARRVLKKTRTERN